MKFRDIVRRILFILLVAGTASACNVFSEDLPGCRMYVKFKYDYNMLSADAFHSQVDKVDLYVFDENGVFVFRQSEEGTPLTSPDYRMDVRLSSGKYRIMAWAGAHDSYDVPELTPGTSTIEEVRLKLKRDQSLIIAKELEPLWYGEITDVDYSDDKFQTVVVNLIRDTNKVRFVFQGYTGSWTINVDDYYYEIRDSNGYLDYDNSLLSDDVLSYRPYFTEQRNPSAGVVELNTMRFMSDRQTRFVVTEKNTGTAVFDINLIDFLLMTKMEGGDWGEQEYFDRQHEYSIIFYFSGTGGRPTESWLAVKVNINGWTHYFQNENEV